MSGLIREWVMDLPCGCRVTRPDDSHDWKVESVEAQWVLCAYGHKVGDSLPRPQPVRLKGPA